MFKRLWGKHVKNQRGLTLIELLATIVILGVISAIAIPSIGGLINNSKKDAAIANAQQIVNAAKIYVASNQNNLFKNNSTTATILLKDLIDDGQIEPVKNPFTDGEYDKTKVVVTVTKNGTLYTYKITIPEHNIQDKNLSEISRGIINAPTTQTTQ